MRPICPQPQFAPHGGAARAARPRLVESVLARDAAGNPDVVRLAPKDPDVLNTEALIHAELGDQTAARAVWMNLIRAVPDYEPARVNLSIPDHIRTFRDSPERVRVGGTLAAY
jgi:hypothetical protein